MAFPDKENLKTFMNQKPLLQVLKEVWKRLSSTKIKKKCPKIRIFQTVRVAKRKVLIMPASLEK